MKRFLPIFFALVFVIVSFAFPQFANAQIQASESGQVPEGKWVIDPEVTFIGKNAARSGNLLDFILQNYNWVCVKQVAVGQCDNSGNPLQDVWLTTTTFIIAPLLLLVILAASIIIIVTRGRSLTITRFFPRFIAVLLLIAISFSLLQFLYQFVDGVQGFFLRREIILFGTPFGGNPCPPDCISQKDLLYVGWNYKDFLGLRLLGDQNSESAFISLLLTKLTALTYYVMVGILILRKIILWLFIIVSPIFPLLLMFYPIRNTGKIWIGEFFRWLLYAPLFAIFLNGLVALWRNKIPLVFSNPDINVPGKEIYPTAVNILLGGPKEYVTPTNSVNLTETFALYVVSLLMLWGVIILPWILLQIFLDYASNIGVGDSAVMKTLVSKINNLQSPPGSPSHPPSGGATINLPFAKKFNLPIPPTTPAGMAREIPRGVAESRSSQVAYMPTAQVKAQVLNLASVPLPTMRDIAKYDTSLISRDADRQKETTVIRDNLQKIGNPASVTSSTEKERYSEIREKLTQESNSGNTLATSILNAASTANKRSVQASTTQIKSVLAQIANPALSTSTSTSSAAGASSVINREKITKMNESLVKAKKEGNTLAASILSVTDRTSTAEIEKLQEKIMDARTKGEPIGTQLAEITRQQNATLPAVNRVQTVSREDYDAVKDMWKENYKNLEVPEGMAGTRVEWIKDDISKIDNIVNLLSSTDQEQVAKGMEEVSSILPFLLVGGFSQAEIVSYLKAKQDAAREVSAELVQDEEDKVSVSVKKTATATQTMSATIPEDSESEDGEEGGLSNLPSVSTHTQNIGSTSSQQVSNEILALSNLKLPKLTDIVQYEIRHLTKDKTESERIEKIQQVLERIGSPESIASAPERTQYEQLREKLTHESQAGNVTADVILSAVSQLAKAASEIDLTLSEVKIILSQIVNPAIVSSSEDKDYYTRLHEYLEKESREKNNVLAQQILSLNSTTKDSEIRAITTQLATTPKTGEFGLPEVTTAMSEFSKVKQLRSVVGEIVTVDSSLLQQDPQVYAALNQSLRTEISKGNTLAASILAVNATTPDVELRKVHQELLTAAQKGDPLATSMLTQVSISSADKITEKEISSEEAKTILKKIANPESVTSIEEKSYYVGLNESLQKESKEKNNTLAQKILAVNDATDISGVQEITKQLLSSAPGVQPALSNVTQTISEFVQIKKLKDVVNKISSSENSQVQSDKMSNVKLRESLTEAKAKGNSLAASILSVNSTTPDATLRQINRDLIDASKKGDPLAKSILSKVTKPLSFAPTNRLQEVKPEDYEEAKKLWEKAYKQYFVPPGFTEDLKGRTEWINKDIADIEETIGLLSSSDSDKKEEGAKKVSNILPFLLLGGFSFEEMLIYLKTKLDAAHSALKSLEEEEDSSISVPIKKEQERPAEMAVTEEEMNNKTGK